MTSQDNAVIRVRRFKLMLFALDEKLKRLGKPICQLNSFYTSFKLNSIPIATVTPLLGTLINGPARNTTFKRLDALTKDRRPVGIYAEITQGFSSEDNKSEKQYWPDTRAEKPDEFGQYANSSYVCIFKGYLLPITKEISAVNATCTMYIQHWLSAITGMSLLSARSHTGNPAELAMAMYGIKLTEKDNNLWKSGIIANFKDITDIWEQGIKPVFKNALDFMQKFPEKNVYNQPIQKLVDRMRLIIDEKIKPDKESLTLEANTTSNMHTLSYCIGMSLADEPLQSFAEQSAWEKLLNRYIPMFLFSIVPRVDDALLIPAPSVIPVDKCKVIASSELLRVSTIDYPDSLMSELVCVATKQDAGRTAGTPAFLQQARYPEKSQRAGITYSVGFPSWINDAIPTAVVDHISCWRIFESPDESISNTLEAQEDELKKIKAKKEIATEFVKYMYLTQLLKATTAKIAVPVRMDICPGACVRVEADGFKDTSLLIYGTVEAVTPYFFSGDKASYTEISLTNIRNTENANDPIDNPAEKVGFYKGVFTGTREEDVLYAVEPK